MFDTVFTLSKIKSQHRLSRQSGSICVPNTSQWYGLKELTLYFAYIVKVKFAHHPLIILTKHVCHHSSFWGSNHATTISLKLVQFHGDFGILFRLMAQVLSKHTSSLTSDHPFRAIFWLNFLLNLPILANIYQTYISRLLTQILKNKADRPDLF